MAEKEYIEREAAIKIQCVDCGNYGFCDNDCSAVESIKRVPAADVRPVVLCRDCIHYKPQQKSARWSSTTPMCSRSATIKMPPDGFCSFGVKREES